MKLRTVVALLVVVATATANGTVTATASDHATPAYGSGGCAAWAQHQVVSGLGSLENLSFDGRGGLLLSASGRIARLTPDAKVRTVVADVTSPGGHVVVGRTLYFTTGNGFADGVTSELGRRAGTLAAVDLRTTRVRVVHRGLAMPNGLVRLPDGSFLVSRDVGLPGRTTRLYANGRQRVFAPSVTSTNGMAVDAERRLVYVVSTFNPTSTISVVDLDHPGRSPRVITLDGFGPANSADELVLGTDGQLYVTLNAAGTVVRVDPRSGEACTIASGIPFASSLRFGRGPGWDPASLYVTSFTGTVTRLTP